MPQSSLVLELQALAQSSATNLAELCRRAKVVAMKLKLDDFKEWLEREMGGYPQDAAVPEYREVQTQLKAQNPFHGLIPIVIEGELAEHFACSPIRQPVGELAHLLHGMKETGTLQIPLSSSEMRALIRVPNKNQV